MYYNQKQLFDEKEFNITLNSFGFSIPIQLILMTAGFIIVFFLMLFYIYWKEQKKNTPDSNDEISTYPDFGVRGHSFYFKNLSLSEVCKRVIWFLFLIAPVLIIIFGIITRYNIVYF